MTFPRSIKQPIKKSSFVSFSIPFPNQEKNKPGSNAPTFDKILPPSSPIQSDKDNESIQSNNNGVDEPVPASPKHIPGQQLSFDSGYNDRICRNKFNQDISKPGFHKDFGRGKRNRNKLIKKLLLALQGEERDPEVAPKSFRAAKSKKFWDKWEAPIKKEYDALIALNTWELILKSSIPPNTTVHNPVWKMKIKDNGRRKARLCFNGFFQEHGINFFETFSPVA